MIQELDFAILGWIQLNLRCEWLDWLMPKVTLFGELGLFWIAVTIVLLLAKQHRRCGAMLACGLTAGLIVGNGLMKHLVARARPCWIDPSVNMLVAVPTDFSFPSGHTLACFIAATVLLRYDRRLGIPALCIAVAVAFSRLYLYVHFPTDVLCGAALGVVIGCAVTYLFERYGSRFPKPVLPARQRRA